MANTFTPQITSSTQTGVTLAPLPGPIRISPGERQFLERQGRAILVGGGSEQDVVDYVQRHVGRSPRARARLVGTLTPDAPSAPEEAPMPLGLTLAALNGATFGFADEAFGSLSGILAGASAAEGREMWRNTFEEFRDDHGVVSFLAELAGGIATGATVARAAGLGTGILAQTSAGAAGGAVAGAGSATGDISDRAKAALTGGVLGGGLGGAIGVGAAAFGPALRETTRAALDRADTMFRGVLSRLRPPQLGNASDAARRTLREVVVDGEGLSVDAMRARALAMRASGVNPTLADVTGDGGLALLSMTMGRVTPVKQALLEEYATRQASQGGRLSGALFRRLLNVDSFGLQNAYALKDDLALKMRRVSGPAYRVAHREMIQVSDKVRTLLERNPILRAGWEEVKKLADERDLIDEIDGVPALERGAPIPELPVANEGQLAQLMGMISDDPSPAVMEQLRGLQAVEFPRELPVRGLDFLQRGVRKVVTRLQGRGGIDAETRITLKRQMKLIVDELKESSEKFRVAHETWAGGSAAQDMIDLARGVPTDLVPDALPFHRKPPQIVAKEVAEARAAGGGMVDFYRIGVMQDLDDLIRGPASRAEGADVARNVFGARTFRNPTDHDILRIRALFPDAPDVADDFTRRVFGEGRLSRTSGALSPERIHAAQNPEKIAERTFPGARMTAILTALGAARDAMVSGTKAFQSEVSDNVARFFSYGMDGPDELDAFFDSLEDFIEREQAARLGGRALAGGISGAFGAQAGQLPSR